MTAPIDDEPTIEPLAGVDWLIDAADLLGEPDPGPTPWLIEGLIVDQAIVAAVGRWKTTKSYALLDMCISVAAGLPAFGAFSVPEPGPVVFINEESGRAALWRRLDALCRGRAIDPERLRGRLHVAANANVKLDDKARQDELVTIGHRLRPRLFVFDPLARMKAAAREENAQADMAVLIEFLRQLRDETKATSLFVHHTGHAGAHMRGSSDLESAWESRLTFTRDGQSPLVTIESEHREAEAGQPVRYRIGWDADTRSMRFDLVTDNGGPTLAHRILQHLAEHGPSTTDEVRAGVGNRRSDVLRTLETLEQAGTAHRGPSEGRDATGRRTTRTVWKTGQPAAIPLDIGRPELGTDQDAPPSEHRAPSHRPTFRGRDGTDGSPDAAPGSETR